MTARHPHPGLARAAQDELAAIYSAPRGRVEPEPYSADAVLETARELLAEARRERLAAGRDRLRLVEVEAS